MPSGAMDILVIEGRDGVLRSTPFHVVFSKLRALHLQGRQILVRVNGKVVPLLMRLSQSGVAVFDLAPHRVKGGDRIEKPSVPRSRAAKQNLIFNRSLTLGALDLEDVRAGDIKSPHYAKIQAQTTPTLPVVAGQTFGASALCPAHQMLKDLGLSPGSNLIEFICMGPHGPAAAVWSSIYLYPHQKGRKLIISDIDGTITKSDVRGHVLSMLKVRYVHGSICRFYEELSTRGYTLIYLTARPLSLVASTHRFLRSVSQDSCELPRGPLLSSADGILISLKRELHRTPTDAFKMQCLCNLAGLFSSAEDNILYAGFGNKEKDSRAYHRAGIPAGGIYEVDRSSTLRNLLSGEAFTYASLTAQIHALFPYIGEARSAASLKNCPL